MSQTAALLAFVGFIAYSAATMANDSESLAESVAAVMHSPQDDVAGGGVLISKDGHVLTAWHVYEAAKGAVGRDYIYVRFASREPMLARKIQATREDDVALLQILDTRDLPAPARLGLSREVRREIQDGKDVHIVGYGHPSVDGRQILFKRYESKPLIGINPDDLYILEYQLYPGHSGGPIFQDGRLIGIVGQTTAGPVGEGVVIPVDRAYPLLHAAGLDPLSEEVTSYRLEILALKEKLRELGDGYNWLLTFLDWDVGLCRDEEADEAGSVGLYLTYKQRFATQARPRRDFELIITPVYGSLPEQVDENEARLRRILVLDEKPRFQDDRYVFVNRLGARMQERLDLYNLMVEDGGERELLFEDLKEIEVEIEVESEDEGIKFERILRTVEIEEESQDLGSCVRE